MGNRQGVVRIPEQLAFASDPTEAVIIQTENWLRENDFNYRKLRREVFEAGVQGKNGSWKVIFFCSGTPTHGFLIIESYFPQDIPTETLLGMTGWINSKNLRMKVGKFEADFKNQKLSLSTSSISFGASLSKMLPSLFLRNVVSFDEALQEIQNQRGSIPSEPDISEVLKLGLLLHLMGELGNATDNRDPSAAPRRQMTKQASNRVIEVQDEVNPQDEGFLPGKREIKLPTSPEPQRPMSPEPDKRQSKRDTAPWMITYDEIEMVEENGKPLKLGEGGFADVFKGKWEGTEVAVKKLRHRVQPNMTKEVMDEIKVMRKIAHPNVVLFLGVCSKPAAIVTQYCANRSLTWALENKRLNISTKLRILHESAIGMAFLHHRGVIHGDLKCLNILLDENMTAKIADFGLSRIIEKSAPSLKSVSVSGYTLLYAAPEVMMTGKQTKSADVYSFAVVMLEVFTEEMPYSRDQISIANHYQFVQQVDKGLRPTIPSSCPTTYRNLIRDCWQHDRDMRPPFADICSDLERMRQTV